MLIEAPVIWIIIIDFVLWFIIHMSVAYAATALPERYINVRASLYKERDWERGGLLYEKLFKIKKWKEILPDGSALFKKGFRKKRMNTRSREYFERFILETCRAEAAHWIVILFSPIFFIWNYWQAGIVMIIYAFFANLPCIMAQRYNRIRFRRLLKARG